MGPPSVSLSAATSSMLRRMVISPQLSTNWSSWSVEETTYLGIALYLGNSVVICGHTGAKIS